MLTYTIFSLALIILVSAILSVITYQQVFPHFFDVFKISDDERVKIELEEVHKIMAIRIFFSYLVPCIYWVIILIIGFLIICYLIPKFFPDNFTNEEIICLLKIFLSLNNLIHLLGCLAYFNFFISKIKNYDKY